MTDKLLETLTLAEEVLTAARNAVDFGSVYDACGNAITAIREQKAELAELAELRPTDDELWDQTLRERDAYHEWADKLADAIAEHFDVEIGEHSNVNHPWANALDAVLDAAPQPVQGPVAWRYFSMKKGHPQIILTETKPFPIDNPEPLYAAPVRTKDLTDGEIDEVERKMNRHYREFPREFARAVIAKFKEKNRG